MLLTVIESKVKIARLYHYQPGGRKAQSGAIPSHFS
jgi:hypothetical protein